MLQIRLRFALAGLCLVAFPGLSVADELTPSGGALQDAAAPVLPGTGQETPISFEAAAAGLNSVFPVQLARMDQVGQNSYNWRGPNDASMRCDIGFAPEALVIRGEFRDDLPFFQPVLRPAMPEWWRIGYGADGVEFLLDDPTSATRRVRFVLNWSSAAISPTVDLLASPIPRKKGPIPVAALELEDVPGSAPEEGAVQFRTAIPYSALAEPDFFRGPLRITVRQHDLDGDMATYLMLQEAIERK